MRTFFDARKKTLEFVGTTQENLLAYVAEGPVPGAVNVTQSILFLSAPSGRHLLQIRKVKATTNFPR